MTCLFSLQGERATGFGVAFLLALFGRASKDAMLNLVSPLGASTDTHLVPNDGDGSLSKRRRLV